MDDNASSNHSCRIEGQKDAFGEYLSNDEPVVRARLEETVKAGHLRYYVLDLNHTTGPERKTHADIDNSTIFFAFITLIFSIFYTIDTISVVREKRAMKAS